jgi:hypothetical protein
MAHHVDCLYAAVSVLAGNGHIKQRLISAYEQHIDKINDEDLPVVSREAFAQLREQLHRVTPLLGESPVCASVRKMSVPEASACAVSFVELYRDVARYEKDTDTRLPIDADGANKVPPFLVKTS